jgi:hypothetical protein
LEESAVPFEPLRVLCDHLVERSATLFLGAGVNAGVVSPDGVTCPLGNELSAWICRDLLLSPDTDDIRPFTMNLPSPHVAPFGYRGTQDARVSQDRISTMTVGIW